MTELENTRKQETGNCKQPKQVKKVKETNTRTKKVRETKTRKMKARETEARIMKVRATKTRMMKREGTKEKRKDVRAAKNNESASTHKNEEN